MRRYETSTPRAALGIAAVAMTSITLGALVVMPARLEAGNHDLGMLAAAQVITQASTRAVTDAAMVGRPAIVSQYRQQVPNSNRRHGAEFVGTPGPHHT